MTVMDDDSTGKHKSPARSAVLTCSLLMGLLSGFIVSEKLYLTAHEADVPRTAAVRSRKLEVGSASRVGRLARPRNQLEQILQRVAPSGEVMIAISNYDLVEDGELLLWLEVRLGMPVTCHVVLLCGERRLGY
jgi:hypothetical protein